MIDLKMDLKIKLTTASNIRNSRPTEIEGNGHLTILIQSMW